MNLGRIFIWYAQIHRAPGGFYGCTFFPFYTFSRFKYSHACWFHTQVVSPEWDDIHRFCCHRLCRSLFDRKWYWDIHVARETILASAKKSLDLKYLLVICVTFCKYRCKGFSSLSFICFLSFLGLLFVYNFMSIEHIAASCRSSYICSLGCYP